MQNSFWTNPHSTEFPATEGNLDCDYLIVGGGISGIMTAYLLAKENAGKIILVEKDSIGSGATGFSAGMILTELEGTNSEMLIKKYGEEFTKSYWTAHDEMYSFIKKIIIEEKLRCDLEETDVYVLAHDIKGAEAVTKDLIIRQKVNKWVSAVNRSEIKKDINIEGYVFGEKVHKGLSVNPLALVQELALLAVKHGAAIFENSGITKTGTIKKSVAQTSAGANISYKHIIFTTDSYDEKNPINHFRTTIGITRVLTPAELKFLKLEDNDMMIENELVNYHYFKVTKDKRLLVGSGDEQTKSIEKDRTLNKVHFKSMISFLKRIFPTLDIDFEYAWTGMYGLSKKGIPHFSQKGNMSRICGAGLQLTSMVMTRYLVHVLLKKNSHPFDGVYGRE